MARERWFVNGWELTDGWFRDVETRDGLYQAAGPSSQAQEQYVAGRHGYLDGVRRTHDGGSFVLQMWALQSSWAAVEAVWHQLLRAAGQAAALAHWERMLADGSMRECWGRVGSAPQPQSLGQVGWRVSLEVHMPRGFWRDEAVTTDATTAGAALPQTLALASKQLGSAPMTDLQFTITGPITNPTVTVTSDPTISDSFTVAGVVPAGATVTVDAGTWAVTATGMTAPTLDKVTWTGNRILEVPPASPGLAPAVPTVVLSGSGGAGGTRLSVAGRTKWLA